ncbi:MAG: sigma factor-like helix-turn-helix DNA-binding protein [Candidatus Paceibacterota bacterium]
MKDINKKINDLISNLSDKQKTILSDRFGLNGNQLTLQKIGDGFGITRERVRQIESQSLKELKSSFQEEFSDIVESAEKFLEKFDGAREDEYFINDIIHLNNIKPAKYIDNKVRFIFFVIGSPKLNSESKELRAFWYREPKDKKNLINFIKDTIKFFKKQDKKKILEDKIHLDKLDSFKAHNHLYISKEFGTNVFGDFGLKSWPEVEPKVVKDKAYLVLREKKQPLHFRDIAKSINDLGIDKEKKMHVQTVHNELIKDKRFVLVGRGMYGLKEHGYEGGTVKEVITKLLKSNGPLDAKEVVELVNEKKVLKENTILLNLQNKKNFQRLEDGRYHIKTS